MFQCQHCGGALVEDDDGDWVCLLCGRPLKIPEMEIAQLSTALEER